MGAQGGAQVCHVFLAQAQIDFAGTGQAHAVAAFAEIVAEWGDEPDLLPCFLKAYVTSRAACAFGQFCHGVMFAVFCLNILEGPILA